MYVHRHAQHRLTTSRQLQASTACLYIAITYILYYDGLLPLLISGGLDFLLLIATIVVAVTVGKPISKLNCENLSETTTVYVVARSGVTSRNVLNKTVDYFTYVASDQPHCYEVKAIWGLSIALCVMFAFSCLVCVGLWHRVKNITPPKDIED